MAPQKKIEAAKADSLMDGRYRKAMHAGMQVDIVLKFQRSCFTPAYGIVLLWAQDWVISRITDTIRHTGILPLTPWVKCPKSSTTSSATKLLIV
jgi:hypothetical protein